jgi:hypothetical protein
VEGNCKDRNEPSAFINGKDQLNDCQFLNVVRIRCSYAKSAIAKHTV